MAIFNECWSWSSTTWWVKWPTPAMLPTALFLQHTFICVHVTPLGSAGHTLSGPTEYPAEQPWSIFLSRQRFLQRKTKALLTTKQESRERSAKQLALRKGAVAQQRRSLRFHGVKTHRFLPHTWLKWGGKGTEEIGDNGGSGGVATRLLVWLIQLWDTLCTLIISLNFDETARCGERLSTHYKQCSNSSKQTLGLLLLHPRTFQDKKICHYLNEF